jgi:monoamine oxidase
MISRRALLKAAALGIVGGPAALLRAQAGASPVLVLGAGIAGISAARALREAGIASTIIEARDRIGGRIHTDRSLGPAADLGAAWIHGHRGNPITALARQFGAETRATDWDAVRILMPGGPMADDAAATAAEYAEAVIEALGRLRGSAGAATSVADAMASALRMAEVPDSARAAVEALVHSEIVLEHAADLRDLSLRELDLDEAFPGDDRLFPNGYDAIAKGAAQGLDIRLGETVRRITYREGGVTVETSRGTHEARACIVTLPLGVLRSGAVEFAPALPPEKAAAISRLRMGTLEKVIVRHAAATWPAEDVGYVAAAESGGVAAVGISLAPVNGAPVVAWLVGGSGAAALAGLPKDDVAARLARRLPGAPVPTGSIITNWREDPYSLGAYSFVPPGASHADRDVLAQPVGDSLFFAGEATHRAYPATVHGAWLSGIAAAKLAARRAAIGPRR